ncbi:MAG: DUF898 family protein [Chitinophagales bacterium]
MTEITPHRMRFTGEGSTLFGIQIVNAILVLVTLGFYWPWARAKKLRYLYSHIEVGGSPLEFHGTGKEMFKGFLKVVGIFILFFGGINYGQYLIRTGTSYGFFLMLLSYLLFLLVIPFAMHGGARYRMSRTSWRGIHMGYRGKLSELLAIYFKGLLFTMLSLGLYGAWWMMDLRRYIMANTRVGDTAMQFEGEGTEYFVLTLKGVFLTYLTLGIYGFRYAMHRNHFMINNVGIMQGEQYYNFKSNTTGMGFFRTYVPATILTIFTLGFAAPWAEVMIMEYIVGSIELDGRFDPEKLIQTEDNYGNAAGEDVVDVLLDIDLA